MLAWGEPRATLEAVLGVLAGGSQEFETPELISVLAGEGAPIGLGEVQGMVNGGDRARASPRRSSGLLVAAVGRVSAAGAPARGLRPPARS